MAPGPCGPIGPDDKIERRAPGGIAPKERAAFVRFNRCMKERGVTIQPHQGPGGREVAVEAPGSIDPKFNEAEKACQIHLAPIGGGHWRA